MSRCATMWSPAFRNARIVVVIAPMPEANVRARFYALEGGHGLLGRVIVGFPQRV